MDRALMSFLVDLATRPDRLAEYSRDRQAYLDRTELSAAAKRAILSGDQEAIAELAGAGGGGPMYKKKKPTYKKKKPMYKGPMYKKKVPKKKSAKKKAAKKR